MAVSACARYADGKVAAAQVVRLSLEPGGIRIAALGETLGGEVIAVWALASLEPVVRDDTGLARIMQRGKAAAVLCDDATFIDALRQAVRRADTASGGAGRRRRAAGWPRVVAWIVAAAASVAVFFWFGLPFLAREAALALPVEWEQELGAGAADQITWMLAGAKAEPCESPAGRTALDALTARLITATPPRLPPHVRVIDTDMVNALALPGGEVLVLRGLIDEAEHPNELAAVLAHEFAHGDLRHPTEMTIKSGLGAFAVGLLLGDVLGGSTMVALAQTLVSAGYTRDAEAAADAQMLDTLRRAGLASAPAAAFFDRLEKEGSVPGAFALLATHPPSAARAERLRAAVPGGADALSPAEWSALKTICGPRRERRRP